MSIQTERLFLALLRSEITGTPPDKHVVGELTAEVLPALYTLAQRHDLAHMLTGALDKLGLLGEDGVSQKFKKARYAAVYRYEQLRYELEAACGALDAAKISYIPLKGAVIRAWYPEPWMRTSCDIDILVHPQDLERASTVFVEQLGYQKGIEGSHDVALFAPGGLHVELHHETVEENRAARAAEVLCDVWADASTENGTLYRMSDAMFYFYHVAHMAKHIETGGCGVRTFMDVWVLQHRISADTAGRSRLLKQGGLSRFVETVEQLSEHWFSEGVADDLCLALEAFILYGGAYGNVETHTAVQQNRKGGRFAYLFGLIFPRYRYLKYQYPILQRRAWLYPFCLVHRLGSKLFGKSRKRTAKKWKQVNAVSGSQRGAAAQLLYGLGLSEKETL